MWQNLKIIIPTKLYSHFAGPSIINEIYSFLLDFNIESNSFFQRTFKINQYLEQHRADHNKFKCKDCSKTFLRREHLQFHEAKIHNLPKEECMTCKGYSHYIYV